MTAKFSWKGVSYKVEAEAGCVFRLSDGTVLDTEWDGEELVSVREIHVPDGLAEVRLVYPGDPEYGKIRPTMKPPRKIIQVVALLVALFVAVPVFAGPPVYQLMKVPVSGAAFVEPETPQAQQPDGGELLKEVKELRKEIAALRKVLEDAIKEEPEPGTDAPASDEKGKKVLEVGLGKCMGCHNEKDAVKKGDKVVLFIGKDFREDLRDRELKAVERVIQDGTMPKKGSGKTLAAAEKTAILAEVKARLTSPDR